MKNLAIHSQSYYDILEVSPQAPPQEIHRAYQRARLAYSPDSPALYTMFTPEEAKELLRLVEEAYTVLGHPERRKAYDDQLAREQTLNELPDFPEPSPEMLESQPVTPPKKDLPEGYARTRLSTYLVDPQFEQELRQIRDFNGAVLKRVREYKKISLDQLCDETRIGRPYMTALEVDDYEALPAAVFTRGFVVQVARIFGLDEKIVADSYMKNFKKYKN